MKKQLRNFGFMLVLLATTATITAQQNIIIDGSTNEIFLYDGIEGDVLTNTNGTGWSGAWSQTSGTGITNEGSSLAYPTGSGTAVYGTAMNVTGTNIITRSFTDTYEMSGSKFYLSYLVEKSGSSEFTIKGYSGANPRYGMQITSGGSIRARAGQSYGALAAGVIDDDTTYLVVLHKNSTTSRVAIFKEGDVIPTDPSNATWIATHTENTGVNLDRFQFEFSGSGTYKVDEVRLGSTFQSVTKGDGKDYALAVASYANLEFTMYPNPATDKLFINTSSLKSQNVQLEIVDLNGSTLLSKKIVADQNEIVVNISSFSQGLYIVKLQNGSATYSQKLIIE